MILKSYSAHLFITLTIAITVTDFAVSTKEEKCTNVYEWHKYCVTSSDPTIEISCPVKHKVEIKKAELRSFPTQNNCGDVNNNSTCNDMRDVESEFNCNDDVTVCVMKYTSLNDSSCDDKGGAEVNIRYGCMPLFGVNNTDVAFALPMTYNKSWTGSMIQIDSHFLALNLTTITTIDTICAIAVPPNTNLQVEMVLSIYWKKTNNCERKVALKDYKNSQESSFCTMDDPLVDLPCKDEEQHLYMSYHNSEPTVQGIFVMYVRAPHQSKVKIICGQDPSYRFNGSQFLDDPKNDTSADLGNPDENNEKEQDMAEDLQKQNRKKDKVDIVPIILGCVAASIIIMILVMIILIVKYRRMPVMDNDKGSISGNSYSTVGAGVYVDGDTKSTLILKKNSASQFKTPINNNAFKY